MPQDTTIYWDGNGRLPALIDSLPLEQQQTVLEMIHEQKKALTYTDPNGPYYFVVGFTILFSLAAIYSNYKTKRSKNQHPLKNDDDHLPTIPPPPVALYYKGNTLNFEDKLIKEVLNKHSPFYNKLNDDGKIKFGRRLKKFIYEKTFIIHDVSGFKEMPILISATAIQISFGLDRYLLPNFDTFNIYPGEFIGTHPFLRILAGNVTGKTINLSWKHFLEGFQYPDDGQNVGMHELAHALHYQTFVAEVNIDREFKDGFVDFDSTGNKVFGLEKVAGGGLYTSYAMRDFQEFWAESVEIFFEKPLQMKNTYPDLYAAMSDLLNQDPAGIHSGDLA